MTENSGSYERNKIDPLNIITFTKDRTTFYFSGNQARNIIIDGILNGKKSKTSFPISDPIIFA